MKPKTLVKASELRQQAELRLTKQGAPNESWPVSGDQQRLLHELQVHQFELEIQNEELRNSEAQIAAGLAHFTALYDGAPVGYFTLQCDGTIIQTNLAGAQLLGLDRSQLLGHRFNAFVTTQGLAPFAIFLQQIFAGEARQSCEVVLASKNQPPKTVQIQATLPTDQREYWVAVMDISDRKRAEQALIASEVFAAIALKAEQTLSFSEERFRSVFKSVNTGIASCDKTGMLLYCNEAFRAMLGYDAEALKQKRFIDFTFPADLPKEMVLFNEILTGQREKYQLEKRCVTADRQIIWVDVFIATIRDKSGAIVNFIGVISDITARKKYALALADSKQKLRALASYQERILERERKHIAGEVHDELGQLLTALKMDISLVRLSFGENPQLLALVDDMRSLVEKTFDVVRQVTSNLRPAALNHGLVAAIEWLASDFSKRSSIRCRLDADEGDILLGDTQATAVFRVIQESLTNVIRHAQAKEVVISWHHIGKKLQVVVTDDGHGFDIVSVGKAKGFGLLGMRERLLALGGTLRIDSGLGNGTTLTIELPLSKRKAS